MAKSKADEWLEQDKLTLLEAWARDGLTDEQIANNMGISVASLYNYKNQHLEILEALKKGKEVVDIEVENALLKKCFGYNVPVKKTFKLKQAEYDPETGKKIKEYEELVEGYDEVHIPADTTSQIFWLKNRKPKQWKDKVETSIDTKELTNVEKLLTKIEDEANK